VGGWCCSSTIVQVLGEPISFDNTAMENKLDLDESIRKLILKIPDFPRAGIIFTDITPVLEQDPVLFRAVIDRMCRPHRAAPPEVIVCIDAMGFIFGAPVAYHLGSPDSHGAPRWQASASDQPNYLRDGLRPEP
jgi:hypothetical protein